MPLADPILVLADETDEDDALTQATRDLLALARRVGTPVLVRCDHCRAAAELIEITHEYRPRAILINATPANDRISAQVAVRLESAIVADVTDLCVEGDHLVAVSDRTCSEIHTPTSVITVRPRTHEPQRELLLAEAEVVVAGGRGVGSAEGFSLLARVAQALGGRLGGTHTAGELGWCPHHARISLPGTCIRPHLYLAVGVSGSVRHRAAIRSARTIVAIDRDPNAPILREADFGIIGDLHKILPAFLEELAARTTRPHDAPTEVAQGVFAASEAASPANAPPADAPPVDAPPADAPSPAARPGAAAVGAVPPAVVRPKAAAVGALPPTVARPDAAGVGAVPPAVTQAAAPTSEPHPTPPMVPSPSRSPSPPASPQPPASSQPSSSSSPPPSPSLSPSSPELAEA